MLELIILAALSLSTYVALDNVKDKSADVMSDVSESVYQLYNDVGRGTGWIAETKSGKKVMVTNVHVCDGPTGVMWTDKNGLHTVMKVIAKDSKHDICILTAPAGSVPLKLADKVHAEETVYLVGFPLIEFMSSNKGLVKGYSHLELQYDLPVSKCKGEKFKIYKVKNREICVFSGTVLVTTANTDAGGSGSPILNKYEEVVGMVMIVAGNIAWGQGVPLSALKEFLNKH